MKRFCCVLLVFIFTSCSNDDTNSDIVYTGTVKNSMSCINLDSERIFEIEMDNHSSIKTFAVPNLPEEYKTSGLQLTFKLGDSATMEGHCVGLYGPDYFYNISDVNIVTQK